MSFFTLGFSSFTWGLAGALFVANLALYTAYDKTEQTIKPQLLVDVLACRKGLRHTAREINKIVALVGLSLVAVAVIPHSSLDGVRSELLSLCCISQLAHGAYSTITYYGDKHVPLVQQWWPLLVSFWGETNKKRRAQGMKVVSLLLGSAASVLLVGAELAWWSALSLSVLAVSLAHFWTMEVDFKLILRVRPFGYLPFLLGVPALVWGVSRALLASL